MLQNCMKHTNSQRPTVKNESISSHFFFYAYINMAMFSIFMKAKSSYSCHSENGFPPHCVETVFLHCS